MREIIADYRDHTIGDREVVDWARHDGIYRDVPLVYLRPVTADEYYEQNPLMRGCLRPHERYFWEVSVD